MIAISILKITAESTKPQNKSHERILKTHNNPITKLLSINWEEKVEKLFLNQSNFPLVRFFQKWKILISINWADKYANIEAITARGVIEKTSLKTVSFIGEFSIVGSESATNKSIIEKKEAKIPVITTWIAFFFPYISEIISVIKNVMGYGSIPTDNSKSLLSKISRSKGYQ